MSEVHGMRRYSRQRTLVQRKTESRLPLLANQVPMRSSFSPSLLVDV